MAKEIKKDICLGVDLGTAFFQVAAQKEDGSIEVSTIRNCFVELPEDSDVEDILKSNNWKYVSDSGKYYVIGEDAIKVAKIIPGKIEIRRPMADGVLNKNEEKKNIILAKIIEQFVGKAPTENSVICTCVSAESSDGSSDGVFHKTRIRAMFENLGWKVKIIEEGFAVILSERPSAVEEDGTVIPMSAIACSMGGGRLNYCLAYKGLPILGLSMVNSGDYIDRKVSESTGVPITQVLSIKEKKLDFTNIDETNEVIIALDAFYDVVINNSVKALESKLSSLKNEFDAPLDIIIAGGTSMPKGLCDKFERIIRSRKFPFKINKIKHASDPRNCVAKGCLIQSILYKEKLVSNKGKEEL